jgi:hypothetical protein
VVGREASWRLGVSVVEYRELEAGARSPTFETWDRICKLHGWPQTFAGSGASVNRHITRDDESFPS